MTQFECLASGHGLIEGPRYRDGKVVYSDVTKGGVYQVDAAGNKETLVPKRRGVGGIALHEDGGIVVTGRNLCHVREGKSTIVFEGDDRVGGFNDLHTDAEGRIYVGSLRSDPFGEGKSIPGELYRIDLDGKSEVLYGDVGITNGIGFSPDGKRIYHSDSLPKNIILHDVDGQGGLSNRRVFAHFDSGLPDGLAVDEEGCVWVANYDASGVHRFTPDGKLDFSLAVPSHAVTSLCFGGEDRRDLYVVTADNSERPELEGCVLKTRVDVAGLPTPEARVRI